MKKNMKTIVLAFIQAFIVIGTLMGLMFFVQKQISPTTVYKWTQEVAPGQDILINHVEEIKIPGSAVNENFATKHDEMIGLKTSARVFAGGYVYKDQAVKEELVNAIDLLDKTKYRVFSLPVNLNTSVGGSIREGDKIDLIFTGKGQTTDDLTGQDREFTYSKAFLKEVLIVGIQANDGYKYYQKDEMYSGDPQGNLEQQTLAGASQNISTLTIALTLDEIEELTARIDAEGSTIRIARMFKEGQNYETAGYVIGNYEKQFTGPANAETSITLIDGN